jgi:DNA-binding NarL/FixJ family response regulator
MQTRSDTEKKARLLVVDDHAFVRMAIIAVLAADSALTVVGEAKDGEEAVALCRELEPEVVLMDLSMPRMDGIEATRMIKAHLPKTSVLILTGHAEEDLVMEAVRAGAAGYVLHGAEPTRLLEAVRAVINGETPLDCGLAMRLLRRFESQAVLAPADSSQREVANRSVGRGSRGAPPESLTPRELEVLGHLARGKPNRQIAQELHLSLSTVKRHVEHIIFKLGVSDRTQAAIKALELGMVAHDDPGG